MLIRSEILEDMKIQAIDGELGSLDDIYFDDQRWQVRYLVADTGDWLANEKVLLAPELVKQVDRDRRQIKMSATRTKIEAQPAPQADQPVSQQALAAVQPLPIWRMGGGLLSEQVIGMRADAIIAMERAQEIRQQQPDAAATTPDPHLRSTGEVTGYHLQARNGTIGHVEDFIINTETWTINYLIVDTRNWLPGRKVLVSPSWATQIDWQAREFHVDLSREAIRNSPEYRGDESLERDYERDLHDHYELPKYWEIKQEQPEVDQR